MTRVMLTGGGMISPAGFGAGAVCDAMNAGVHFFNRKQEGKRSLHPRFPWPEASLENPDIPWPEGGPWPNMKKYANASAHQAVAVARLAMEMSGPVEPATAVRSGCVIASGSRTDELGPLMSKLGAMSKNDPRPLAKLLYDEVPDYSYLRGIPCQIGQFLCLDAGFTGSNVAAYGEAGASGLGALALAVRILQSGELDRVLVVGVGAAIPPAMLVAFDKHDPLGRCCDPGCGPFDAGRSGTLLGHGAAAIVLERSDVAKERGAPCLAEVAACEAINATTREGAMEHALAMVLDQAELTPDFWWAHGAASVEMDAIEQRCADSRVRAPITASKGTIGNSFEASGLVDVLLAIEAMQRAEVPPIGLFTKPDPEFEHLDFVRQNARALPGKAATALVTALDHRVECAGAVILANVGS